MRNCWQTPNILELHFNNKYWQVKETKNGTFYLYAAYYDVRKAQRLPECLARPQLVVEVEVVLVVEGEVMEVVEVNHLDLC